MRLANWLQRVFCRGSVAERRGGSVGRPATALHGIESLEPRELLTINVVIDYSLDTNNFFDTQAKKDLLQTAADAIGSRLTDSLSAISPGGSNS